MGQLVSLCPLATNHSLMRLHPQFQLGEGWENRYQSPTRVFEKNENCCHSSDILSFLLVIRWPATPYIMAVLLLYYTMLCVFLAFSVKCCSFIFYLQTCFHYNRIVWLRYLFWFFNDSIKIEQKLSLKWLKKKKTLYGLINQGPSIGQYMGL